MKVTKLFLPKSSFSASTSPPSTALCYSFITSNFCEAQPGQNHGQIFCKPTSPFFLPILNKVVTSVQEPRVGVNITPSFPVSSHGCPSQVLPVLPPTRLLLFLLSPLSLCHHPGPEPWICLLAGLSIHTVLYELSFHPIRLFTHSSEEHLLSSH